MAEKGLSARYNMATFSQVIHNNEHLQPARNLVETNLMLQDSNVMQANEMLGHTGSRQTSLTTPSVVKIGAYWSGSVAQWSKFHDDISIFRDTIVIPQDVEKLHGPSAVAEAEASHMEGFGQGVQNHLIYGTSVQNSEKFDGFDVRYSTPDDNSGSNSELNPATTADYGVWDAGGTGSDTTSIWFIQWGNLKTSLITPFQDPMMGIRVTDMGLQKEVDAGTTTDSTSHRWSYYTELEWWLGLSIYDLRGVARLRNIESSIDALDLNIIKQITEIKTEAFKGPETVWMYVPPRMETHMKIMVQNKQNVMFSKENPYGVPLLMWDDSPIRRVDAINLTETAVAAA